jgi:STE24 endopeptidase
MPTSYLLLFAYLLVFSFGLLLRFLNLRHLKRFGADVPDGFEESVDHETLARTCAYTLEQSRVGLVESILDTALLLVFLFGGILPLYDRWISSLSDSFILRGLLFFLFLYGVQTLIGIPFSLYSTFRLEARYGFNTTTVKTWLTDLAKSTLIALILMGLLLSGALALVQASPRWWWLWVWLFFAAVSIFLMYLSPYVIEPLFNKFEPVTEEGLEDEITALMGKAGLAVSKVQQVDASKRSRHSNAYFTGIGRVKRIVLFDTLISQMTHREILAVLAHEVGHWKLGHIRWRLILTEVSALAVTFLGWWLITTGFLPHLLELPPAETSFMAQMVILSFLGTLAGFPLTPLSSWLSRRHEWQADRYAVELSGLPGPLASALVKLSTENLANLHPHPLYAAFYYSHPPVVLRVARLHAAAGEPCEANG